MHLSNHPYLGWVLLRLLLEDVLPLLQLVCLFEALHLFIISTYNPQKFLFISTHATAERMIIGMQRMGFSFYLGEAFSIIIMF